jgi:hypothetical protein
MAGTEIFLDFDRRRRQMKHQQTAAHLAPEGVAKARPARSTRKGNGGGNSGNVATGNACEEMIRERAYFLYEARQREGGHELDDWLQAEAQLGATPSLDA